MKNSITRKQLIEFGFLVGLGFPILIGWIIPALSGHNFRAWTLLIGIPLLVLGCFKPKLLSFPYQLWMKLGEYLGWINSHLILGIVFLAILNPIALIMKLFNYDPLKKKWSNCRSYREIKKNDKIDITRIF